MKLAALATNQRQTAEEAGKAFNVATVYSSGRDLVADPRIDLVTVAARVPQHRELVLAAIAAGKHVYCEWPLGRNLAEAIEMASAAQAAGVHTAIGLQLRESEAAHRARGLISSGEVGRLLSVSANSSVAGFGPEVPAPYAYLENPANFANLVTIQGAHTIDLAIAIAGPLRDLSALLTRQYPEIKVGEERDTQARTTFDHLLLHGQLAGNGTLAVAVAGARPPDRLAWFEFVGETGVVRLEGTGARGVQSGKLTLVRDGQALAADERGLGDLPDTAVNVAGVYSRLRDDITSGRHSVADFDHAVRVTRLIEDIFRSSHTGARTPANQWPEA